MVDLAMKKTALRISLHASDFRKAALRDEKVEGVDVGEKATVTPRKQARPDAPPCKSMTLPRQIRN